MIMEKLLRDDKRAPAQTLMDDVVSSMISLGRERNEAEYRFLLETNGLAHLRVCIDLTNWPNT